MEQKIFSVSEVNQHIKGMLDSDRSLNGILISGELSNYKIYPSGHHYFTLKDSDGALRAVMFKREASKLVFRPENGMAVIAGGRITVFPRDGQYQLYCNELTPAGAGSLHIAFEQLKEKLYNEGLFDPAHKKPLPYCPERIAIITSSAGAAVRDMIRILGQRYPLSKVLLLPVRVQGEEAPAEIAGALRYANAQELADVIIVGRGGGSIEDLWAFNDERVARAIFASEIPVISAVGHEPDITISDFVADFRASTPSNAAEVAVPDERDLSAAISSTALRMNILAAGKIAALRERLASMTSARVMQSPMGYIEERRLVLDRNITRLASAQERKNSANIQHFVALAAKLDSLSPLKVLARGYSITSCEGRVIKSSSEIEVGSSVEVRLGTGGICCTVDEKF